MYKLKAIADTHSIQFQFENLMRNMGVQFGAMVVNETKNVFINEHIQWMWEQFKREKGIK